MTKKKIVTNKPETIKNLAIPTAGWKDTFVRAAKTFVAGLIAGIPISPVLDVSALKLTAIAAGSAAVTIIINKILLWANS